MPSGRSARVQRWLQESEGDDTGGGDKFGHKVIALISLVKLAVGCRYGCRLPLSNGFQGLADGIGLG